MLGELREFETMTGRCILSTGLGRQQTFLKLAVPVAILTLYPVHVISEAPSLLMLTRKSYTNELP